MISIDMFVSRFFAEIEKFKFDMIEVRNDVLLLILHVSPFVINQSQSNDHGHQTLSKCQRRKGGVESTLWRAVAQLI